MQADSKDFEQLLAGVSWVLYYRHVYITRRFCALLPTRHPQARSRKYRFRKVLIKPALAIPAFGPPLDGDKGDGGVHNWGRTGLWSFLEAAMIAMTEGGR
jgi:hypothetical protein